MIVLNELFFISFERRSQARLDVGSGRSYFLGRSNIKSAPRNVFTKFKLEKLRNLRFFNKFIYFLQNLN